MYIMLKSSFMCGIHKRLKLGTSNLDAMLNYQGKVQANLRLHIQA